MATVSRRKLANYVAIRLVDGASAAEVMKELAAYLVSTRRTNEVELIVRDVESALARHGVVVAEVVSARELSETAKQGITSYVQQQTQAKQVTLSTTTDESVIGGVTVAFGGKQLDTTVKKKLEKLSVR